MIKLGGSPSKDFNFTLSPTTEGVDSSNDFVYDCIGLAKIYFVGPRSTILPAYITAILSVISAITAISWEM